MAKNKIFHLANCDTCQKILKELDGAKGCELQNIKEHNINENDLDAAAQKLGSYEALFSRRALKFRQWGLHEKELTENDFRDLILKEYTFLKRPVMFIGEKVFAGNLKSTVEAAKQELSA